MFNSLKNKKPVIIFTFRRINRGAGATLPETADLRRFWHICREQSNEESTCWSLFRGQTGTTPIRANATFTSSTFSWFYGSNQGRVYSFHTNVRAVLLFAKSTLLVIYISHLWLLPAGAILTEINKKKKNDSDD